MRSKPSLTRVAPIHGFWDQIHAILERFAETPVDRRQALAVVLQDVVTSTKPH
jgi:hypothetical protein